MFPIRVKAYRSGGTSPDFRKIVVVEFEKKPLQKLLRIITAKSGYEQKQIEEDRMSFNQECQKNFSTDWELLFSCQHSLRLTFWRLAQWRISEHKTVNTPQKLMRGRMFN